MSHTQVAVVGAGLAAASFIDELREQGDERSITLIGNEGVAPYERPGLSKEVLQGKDPAESVFVHDEAYYADHGVKTFLDDGATSIDIDSRKVTLASGEEVTYDDLVLATGSRARKIPLPGIDLDGVYTLRTMADSKALKETFGQGKKIVIIGGGWIGLEVAAAAKLAGSDVTVLEAGHLPLQRVLGTTLGEHFKALHEANGVNVRVDAAVAGIEGDGKVSGVKVGDETIPADAVIVAVGAVTNTDIVADTGLTVDNGVVVDEHLQAGDHVWAIGDVANAYNTAMGERVRVEHWDNAGRQGKLAAQVLAGKDASYDWHPYFFTDQFDLGMEYVGHSSADDEVVIRGDQQTGEFIAFWLRDGVVTAGMNVNIWDVSDQLRALIGHKIDPAKLTDTNVELTDLA